MIRTSKTIVSISVMLAAFGTAGFAEETKSVKAAVVTPAVTAAPIASPKFENYDPATYKGKTGTINLPMAGQSMILLRRWANNQLGDYMQISGKEKTLKVPVGAYKVQYCFVSVPGKDGTSWTINTSGDISKEKPIEIKAGKSIALPGVQEMAKAAKSAKTGTIILPYEGQGNVVLLPGPGSKSSGYMQASCKTNKLTVPVGSYIIAQYVSVVTDKDGAPWSVTCTRGFDPSAKASEIKQGEDIKFESSEPFTASIDAKQDGDKLNLSLAIADASGKKCTVQRTDGKGEAPGFQVLSESGEVLMSGKFAYG